MQIKLLSQLQKWNFKIRGYAVGFMRWSKNFEKTLYETMTDYDWDWKSGYLAVGSVANLVLTWGGCWGVSDQDTSTPIAPSWMPLHGKDHQCVWIGNKCVVCSCETRDLSVTEQNYWKVFNLKFTWVFSYLELQIPNKGGKLNKNKKNVLITGKPMQLPIPEKAREVNLTIVNNLKWL